MSARVDNNEIGQWADSEEETFGSSEHLIMKMRDKGNGEGQAALRVTPKGKC